MKVQNIVHSLNKTSNKLADREYQVESEALNICKIFTASALILEIRKSYGLTYKAIGDAINVKEKNVRAWESARQGITVEHLCALAALYEKLSHKVD